ncbi:MAG: transcription-repair coupling factor [Erysipelotrichaceae bacterium]|nr:transcription-repair coupling factor [Erysipelotrichaceae bacterium]
MSLWKILENNAAVDALLSRKEKLASLSEIEEALIIAAAYRKQPQNILVVKNNLYNAQRVYERLRDMLTEEDVVLFGVEESLRIEAIASSPEIVAEKIETLNRLNNGKTHIVVTHGAGLTHYLPDPDYFTSSVIEIKINEETDMKELAEKFRAAGYEEVSRVDQPLTFARRGGIIDIFSINYEHPVRIEFFDTEVDSIRFFDLSSQRTLSVVDSVKIVPATDILFTEENIKEIHSKVEERMGKQKEILSTDDYQQLNEQITKDLDYIDNHIRENYLYRYYSFLSETYTVADYLKDPLIFLSTREAIKKNLKDVMEENVSYIQELYEDRRGLLSFQVNRDLNATLEHHDLFEVQDFIHGKETIDSGIYTLNVPSLPLRNKLETINSNGKRNLFLLSENEIKQAIEALLQCQIPYQIIDFEADIPEGISICMHPLSEGFELYQENLIVFSGKELFDSRKRLGRFANKFKEAEVLNSYLDLQVGDYVVHNLYGIGQYLGIVTKEINQIHKDFLNIAYRGDDVLLVPLEQFHLVRKFVSREGVTPKLNKLGSSEWSKTKQHLKENVDNIAERLVALYANRENLIGYAFSKDGDEQRRFEKDFPYELTRDQKIAIREVKEDMESQKPMDRLLCGDVGFGKTEVALQATFKAANDLKQVAYLCPTTILAHQHYNTFRERLEPYGIRVGLLNRFVSEKEQKQVIQDLKEGKLDVIIGTHRILSKDIHYKDLGLLIIDEEQRFGVEHKEKIKEIKNSIDVLSLSATPIPRTLQMSLIGIRSLSQLNTPPDNRLPVLTYVIEKNRSVIKEVIQRELVRHGQVFYLYNNIKDIYAVASRIRQDVPDAKVAVVHGKMDRTEIEDVMYQFVQNEYNVLICTTIIETGIDIPNANTMIIDNADRFGLSQLYQIKGRVGRSDRLAYAYLMYTPQKQLTEIAQKRLTAIKEFTELGSGYKIAMRDLTIRGAGDLLGAKQSGFIDTVGIDMYIEMLNEAIAEKKGEAVETKEVKTTIPMKVDAYIPEQFATRDYEKITLYQRIDAADNFRQLRDLEEEITDEYGKLPAQVSMLFEKKRLEILLKEPRIQNFKENERNVQIEFTEEYSSKVDGVKLFEIVGQAAPEAQLKYLHGNIILILNNKKNWLDETLEVLKRTKESERQ